jgi:hypothetical protein
LTGFLAFAGTVSFVLVAVVWWLAWLLAPLALLWWARPRKRLR